MGKRYIPTTDAERDDLSDRLEAANARVKKLEAALSGLIPWAGESPEGPSWATPEAKVRNKAMCEAALKEAMACFPANYNGIQEIASSN